MMTCEDILRAIIARIDGVWDNPCLEIFGPLSTNTLDDIKRIAQSSTTIQNPAVVSL